MKETLAIVSGARPAGAVEVSDSGQALQAVGDWRAIGCEPFAASLITRPNLLFLDEPTTGLDPRSRQQTWESVRAIVAPGTTVVLTTQYLDEADWLSDRIAVIDRGTVIAEGTCAELKSAVRAGSLRVRLSDHERRGEAQQLLSRELHARVRLDGDPAVLTARIATSNGSAELGTRATRALAELLAHGVAVSQFALGLCHLQGENRGDRRGILLL